MNTSGQPIRQRHRPSVDPMDYAFRRLTSFAVVGGVFAGFVSATLLASAGLPDPIAVGAGVLAFVVIPSIATGLAARRRTIQRETGPL